MKIKHVSLKKAAALFSAFALGIATTGCGSSSSPAQQGASKAQAASAEQITEQGPEEGTEDPLTGLIPEYSVTQ